MCDAKPTADRPTVGYAPSHVLAGSIGEIEQIAQGYRTQHCDAMAIRSLADRDFRIDLFRGLALWWIFLDHVPETYFNHFTPKNFGFSDAAEIPVFLSGLASGSVYGAIALKSGWMAGSLRALRRAVEIYIAEIVTIIVLLTEISLLPIRQPSLLDHANLAVFVANPVETLFQAALLRYSPVDLDPLLLMAILHFGLVLILPVMVRWPTPTLIASALLYVVSHWLDWSISASISIGALASYPLAGRSDGWIWRTIPRSPLFSLESECLSERRLVL